LVAAEAAPYENTGAVGDQRRLGRSRDQPRGPPTQPTDSGPLREKELQTKRGPTEAGHHATKTPTDAKFSRPLSNPEPRLHHTIAGRPARDESRPHRRNPKRAHLRETSLAHTIPILSRPMPARAFGLALTKERDGSGAKPGSEKGGPRPPPDSGPADKPAGRGLEPRHVRRAGTRTPAAGRRAATVANPRRSARRTRRSPRRWPASPSPAGELGGVSALGDVVLTGTLKGKTRKRKKNKVESNHHHSRRDDAGKALLFKEEFMRGT